jgi:hypothetical protein
MSLSDKQVEREAIEALSEIATDYLTHNPGKLLSKVSVINLLRWSNKGDNREQSKHGKNI